MSTSAEDTRVATGAYVQRTLRICVGINPPRCPQGSLRGVFRLGSFSVSNNDTKTPPLDPLPGGPVPYFLQHRLQRKKTCPKRLHFGTGHVAIYFLNKWPRHQKRLIRRAVYSFACLRLFLPCQRRGCVVRAGFAAMHTLFF